MPSWHLVLLVRIRPKGHLGPNSSCKLRICWAFFAPPPLWSSTAGIACSFVLGSVLITSEQRGIVTGTDVQSNMTLGEGKTGEEGSPVFQAYSWYNKLGQPSRADFKKRIAEMRHCEITNKDIDSLPWNFNGTMVNIAKIHAQISSGECH